MDALRQERKWNRIATGEGLGVSTHFQRVWAGQFKTLGSDLETMSLPNGDCPDGLQITDPASPNFGATRFLLGYSTPGGPDVLE